MQFELTLGAAPAMEVPRLLNGQIAGALDELKGAPDETAIHDARRHIKKARAVLRLIDETLHGPLTRGDRALRAAGRHLSASRDEAVLRNTIDALITSGPAAGTVSALRALRETLPASLGCAADPQAVHAAREALLEARLALAGAVPEDYAFDSLIAAFAASYRAGRHALRRALAEPSADRLHGLRKALKHHVYHLRVLQPLWPQLLDASHAAGDHAAELLGLHHDCAVLRERLADSPLSRTRSARIDAVAAKRQEALAAAALDLCRRLYAEPARCYARRLRAYWQHPQPAPDGAPGKR